jgi:23S rRNA (adenine2030-N6)-methyltransferase
MNYRHGFHAGNFADVLKHAALLGALDYLAKKPKPFLVLDTHAGRGIYDLTSDEALRAGEFRGGAGRVMAAEGLPPLLAAYRDLLARLNPAGPLQTYPGSPLIAAGALRPGDRLVACELHEGEAEALKQTLKGRPGTKALARDGYAAIPALLPPPERRALVLIDPPFEAKDEFAALTRAVRGASARFQAAAMLVWYPLKAPGAAETMKGELVSAGLRDLCAAELFVRDPGAAPGMAGSGLLLVNLGFALEARLRDALAWMETNLAQGPGARGRFTRIAAE